jgi:hypothetical protein
LTIKEIFTASIQALLKEDLEVILKITLNQAKIGTVLDLKYLENTLIPMINGSDKIIMLRSGMLLIMVSVSQTKK